MVDGVEAENSAAIFLNSLRKFGNDPPLAAKAAHVIPSQKTNSHRG